MSAAVPNAAAANSQGMAALREGRFADAAAAFRAAIAADPSSGALLRNLASAFRAQGSEDEELAALDGALSLDRRDMVAWIRKAEIHQRKAENGPALEAWHAALALAEPLRPWSGPLAAALATGEAFQAKAVSAITDAVGAEVACLAGDLDETERRRSTAFIDLALGRRRTYVNECAGLYYPFLPADEFFDDRHFPWFAELASATDAIRDELEALLGDPGEALRPYVRMDAGTPDSHWTPLDQSLDWGACFLWEYGEPNRQVIERCPRTAEVIASIPGATIPGRAPNAFFSLLRPRTRIPPHTGVTNTRAIVHLPLIVPQGCGFRVGGETRSWVEGQPLAFDDTIEHEAWNDSASLRAVLILDCWNPHLTEAERQIITRYFDAADSAGYTPRREE
jgi:aspartyl/asparaginyl beta-hydroxylase (cupin superfamily)